MVELADVVLARVRGRVARLAGTEAVVAAGLTVVVGIGGLVAAVRVPAVTRRGDVGLVVQGRGRVHVVRARVDRQTHVEAVVAADDLGLGPDRRAVVRRAGRGHTALDVAIAVRVELGEVVLTRVGGRVARLAGTETVVAAGLAVVVGIERLVAAVGVPAVARDRLVGEGVSGTGGVDAGGVRVHGESHVQAVLAGQPGGARRREVRALDEQVPVVVDLLGSLDRISQGDQGLTARRGPVRVAVGVPPVADLGLPGVHRRGHREGHRHVRGRQDATRRVVRVLGRVVQAVEAADDQIPIQVDRARRDGDRLAVEVGVEIVVPLRGVRGHERRVRAAAEVVPAVAEVGGAGVDRREGIAGRSVVGVAGIVGVNGDVGAVVGAGQALARLGHDRRSGPADVALVAVQAVDVAVTVVVELVGLKDRRGDARGRTRVVETVVVPAVADLGVAGEDGRRGDLPVHRELRSADRVGGIAARNGPGRRQDLVAVLQAVDDRVRIRRVADRVAVAVVVVLVDLRPAETQHPVAVRVQLVAQLSRNTGVDGRVAVVAVAAGEAAEAEEPRAEPIAVTIDLAGIAGQGVAVVVLAVRELGHARVDQGRRDRRGRVRIVFAVAAAHERAGESHAGSGIADHPVVTVLVLLHERDDRVAVVVESVADLDHLRAALVVGVVAVAVGGAVVVPVQIELAVDAGDLGVAGPLAVLAGVREAVGVVAGIARALVVHQDVGGRDPGRRDGGEIERVGQLRRAGVDGGGSCAQGVGRVERIVLAVVAAGHAQDGVAEVRAVRRAADVAVAVQIGLVGGHVG